MHFRQHALERRYVNNLNRQTCKYPAYEDAYVFMGCPRGGMCVRVNVLTPGQTKQLSLSIKLPFMWEKMSLIISESQANDQ